MTRRTRERIVDSTGRERVQTGEARADVLHYPAHDITTVLVRRTHDLVVSRRLAEERWAELAARGLVDQPLGVDDRAVRVGWWQTRLTSAALRERDDAVDVKHRTVRACLDTAPGAGAGVEYRP